MKWISDDVEAFKTNFKFNCRIIFNWIKFQGHVLGLMRLVIGRIDETSENSAYKSESDVTEPSERTSQREQQLAARQRLTAHVVECTQLFEQQCQRLDR